MNIKVSLLHKPWHIFFSHELGHQYPPSACCCSGSSVKCENPLWPTSQKVPGTGRADCNPSCFTWLQTVPVYVWSPGLMEPTWPHRLWKAWLSPNRRVSTLQLHTKAVCGVEAHEMSLVPLNIHHNSLQWGELEVFQGLCGSPLLIIAHCAGPDSTLCWWWARKRSC